MKLKVKLWIEDKEKRLIFGDGKNLILSYIDKTNSISKTAEELNMPQENVLRHIDILEQNNDEEMILKIQGLKKDSVATYVLTPQAREMLQTYQIYQYDVNKFAQKKFKEIFENYK